jgi:hypothetical protein
MERSCFYRRNLKRRRKKFYGIILKTSVFHSQWPKAQLVVIIIFWFDKICKRYEQVFYACIGE